MSTMLRLLLTAGIQVTMLLIKAYYSTDVNECNTFMSHQEKH